MTRHVFIDRYKLDNPFYDNHVFSKADMKRSTVTRWDMPFWGFFHTTYVQVNEGHAFYYKIIRGQYYLMKVEDLYCGA